MQTIFQKGSPDSAGVDLIDEKQAAEVLDVVPGTLAVWRCTKRYKIPYIKIGRNVRYSRRALQEWLDSCTHNAGE